MAVFVAIGMDVDVGVSVAVGVGVSVGPNSFPGSQPANTKIMVKRKITVVLNFLFMFAPVLSWALAVTCMSRTTFYLVYKLPSGMRCLLVISTRLRQWIRHDKRTLF